MTDLSGYAAVLHKLAIVYSKHGTPSFLLFLRAAPLLAPFVFLRSLFSRSSPLFTPNPFCGERHWTSTSVPLREPFPPALPSAAEKEQRLPSRQPASQAGGCRGCCF